AGFVTTSSRRVAERAPVCSGSPTGSDPKTKLERRLRDAGTGSGGIDMVGIVRYRSCNRLLSSGPRRGGTSPQMTDTQARIGWIGTGRMGAQLVRRLLDAGCDVAVWNRTRAKAEPLAQHGATIVESPADLAGRDIVFTM